MATRKSTSPKPRRIVSRKPQRDEFSAAGGVPSVPAGLPANDLSQGRQAINELTWGEFDRQVQALARTLARTFKPEAVVGLVHGGIFVGGALASALKADFFPVRVSQRSRDSRAAQAADDLPEELAGKRVLIVDDVASSGDSIVFATKLARARGVKAIKSAALIARPGKFEPDFVGLTSADFFVFPWDYQDVVDDRRFETGETPAVKRKPRAS